MDFSLILVLATLAAGLIWGGYRAVRALSGAEPAAEPVVVEYARSFFPVLLLVLVVRSFLFEPFRIPSSSMMPTLLIGDFIFVNKYSYGLRLPVLNTKIVDIGEPERGDVIVFRLPSDPSINYIKRLVGMPGDTIRYAGDHLYINDQPVAETLLGVYDGELQPGSILMQEQLGKARHQVLLIPGVSGRGDGTFVVPPGHYFMMGDNRDNSQDSRFIGPIPEGNIVGRAVRIWMNWDFPAMPRWSRIGRPVE